MTVTAQFLGGAHEVGRLGLVLEHNDARLLFDYGLSPDKPVPSYPAEAPPVDLIMLSHAHLDHSGMLPWVASRYETTILATAPSAEVATVLHNDSFKIAQQEGFPSKYDKHDIKHTQKVFDYIKHAEWREAAGMELHFHSAGHIPGSTMFDLRGDRRILFTGDLQTRNSRLVWGARAPQTDLLFMESTYAGREAADRQESEKKLIDAIQDTLRRGGTAIVPSFAVGRSQEIALVLKDQGFNVYLDGMARQVLEIYLRNPAFIRNKKELEKAAEQLKIVHTPLARKNAIRGGNVILTTSGMLDGGPVLGYLDKVRNDSRSGVFMTGYQVEGSNGRKLLDEGKIEVDGQIIDIQCRVERFDFSAHAGHSELVKFAKDTGAKDIVLFHGDNPEALKPDLQDFANVYTPRVGEKLVFK